MLLHIDKLIFIQVLTGRNQVPGHIHSYDLIAERHRGVYVDQPLQSSGSVPGFLLQLPCRAYILWLSHIIQSAGRHFKGIALQGIPVLAHHQDFPLLRHRHHRRRAFMLHKVPYCGPPVGQRHIILVYIQYHAFVGQFSFDPSDLIHSAFSFLPQCDPAEHFCFIGNAVSCERKKAGGIFRFLPLSPIYHPTLHNL